MENPVNCWKPKSIDMAISSRARIREGSETIREDGVHSSEWKRRASHVDEDIVRSLRKLKAASKI